MTGYRCRRCKEEIQKEAKQCPHCGFNPDSARTTGTVKGIASVALQGATLGIAGRGLEESAKNELDAAREGVAEKVPEEEDPE